mgnify:CR=1 FL=1|tara:strand:+ start:436 stop:687 length:252 start_codon:yes stop_codon:yes gene_type:complete
MTKLERTILDLRKLKDAVSNHPNNSELSDVEQKLMDDLNYKAALILKLEDMFEDKKIPVDSKSLYSFKTEELESVWGLWTAND